MKEIKVAIIEGRFLKSVIRNLLKAPGRIRKALDKLFLIISVYIMSRFTPVEDNKIIFITSRGAYDCNAKWIAQEIVKRGLPYHIVWTIRRNTDPWLFPAEYTLVERGSYDFYRHLSSAKMIVDNSVNTAYLGYWKKRTQILIETWHGSLGIKKFSKDTNKDKKWVFMALLEGRLTDYILSNSTFEDAIYREDYWKKTRILQLGHARNDILCERDTPRLQEIRTKVFRTYNLPEDTRICLYAPTFRDDGDLRPYMVDYTGLQQALETRFGGNWVIMTRFHFIMLKKTKKYHYPEHVINASHYPDIQELVACTDVGITDYSSWICDYLLTGRPGFLFATDMTEYEKKDRDFFYPLDTLPFPLAVTNRQLIQNILDFDNETFVRKCDAFLKDKGCMDDGHASERIVDAIEQIMRGEKL